jgi:hypothetical protein
MKDYVAWDMFDGNVMVGRIREGMGYGRNEWIERIDGSLVSVCNIRLRPATYDDFNAAVRFFNTIGEN